MYTSCTHVVESGQHTFYLAHVPGIALLPALAGIAAAGLGLDEEPSHLESVRTWTARQRQIAAAAAKRPKGAAKRRGGGRAPAAKCR
jgi:hypothetical protein